MFASRVRLHIRSRLLALVVLLTIVPIRPTAATAEPAAPAAATVAPAAATVAPGDQMVFSVAAPALAWSIVSGGGSITAQGLYTAPAFSDTVRIRAATADGSAEATVAVRSWAPLADTPLPESASNAMAFGSDGRLYLGTDTGLYAMDPRQGSYWQAESLAGVEGSSDVRIYALASDTAGRLFIGTGRGAYRRDPGRTFWVPLQTGFPTDQSSPSVASLLFQGGTLYAGLESGAVYRLAAGATAWQQLGVPPSNRAVGSLLVDDAGRLYAGAGAVFRFDTPANPTGVWANASQGLPSEIVGTLANYGGKLYASLRNKGLFAYNGTAWSLSNERGGALLRVGDELFAAGSSINNTAVIRRSGDSWQPLTPDSSGLPGGGAQQIAVDDTGAVYLSQSRVGVFRSARSLAPATPTPPIATVIVAPTSLSLSVGTNAYLAAALGSPTAVATGTYLVHLPLVSAGGASGSPASPLGGVYWVSANPAVATVDGRGIVAGVAVGSTTITAIARLDPARTASIPVVIVDPAPQVDAVTIASSSASVEVSSTITLYADVVGSAFGDAVGVSWESSDPGVATVDGRGTVTGVAVGSTTITARARADASKQATVALMVVPSAATTLPGGGTWQNITANLPANPKNPGRTARVSALTFYEDKLYAGTATQGIWRRNGAAWQQVGQPGDGPGQLGPFGPVVNEFAVGGDGKLYAALSRRVARLDGDNNWASVSSGLPAEKTVHYLRSVGGVLYGLVDVAAGGSQIFRYDGAAWAAVGQVFAVRGDYGGMAVADGTFYLGGGDGHVYAMPITGGTWADSSNGLAMPGDYDGRDVATRALSAAPDGTLFVIVDKARNKVYRRAPGAAQWTLVVSYAYGQGAGNSGTSIGDALYLGGSSVVKIQGTARATLGAHLGSSPRARIYAIASPDGGKTIYAGGDSDDEPGKAVFMIAPDPAAPQQDSNLPVSTASYLGNSINGEAMQAVDIAPDSSVVVAGLAERAPGSGPTETLFGTTPTLLLGGGNGVVVRLDPTGRQIRSVTRIGAQVTDMEVDRGSGRIAVASDLGVTLLSASADRVIWHQPLGAVERVAVASDGTVAALRDKTLWTFSAAGVGLGTRTLNRAFVTDVAIAAGARAVFVSGFDNKKLPYGQPVQVAFLLSYGYDLQTQHWTNWGFDGKALSEATAADSRGYRVAMGRDDRLYFLGENAGGNSIFQKDPRDPNLARPTVQYDLYNQPVQTASAHFAYYARLDPATGELLGAQLAIPRLDDGKSNTYRPRAITADEQGYIYVAGEAAFRIDNRDVQQIGGHTVASYAGGDSGVLVVSPDFATRMVWTTWAAGGSPAHSTTPTAIAAAQGIAAMAAIAKQGTLLTAQPLDGGGAPSATLQPGNPDGFVSVWPGYAGR